MQWIKDLHSYENDIVYDCFGGSGTTGKVADGLNRKWIMSELDTDIYNKAIEKWGTKKPR